MKFYQNKPADLSASAVFVTLLWSFVPQKRSVSEQKPLNIFFVEDKPLKYFPIISYFIPPPKKNPFQNNFAHLATKAVFVALFLVIFVLKTVCI
jgi:hypothetical protein